MTLLSYIDEPIPKPKEYYNGYRVSHEMYELLKEFEAASLTYAKTAAEYIDKIGKQGRNDRLDNDIIRKLIDFALTNVGYSKGHIRRVIADRLPELIRHKFAHKPKQLLLSQIETKPQLERKTRAETREIKMITSTNNITSDSDSDRGKIQVIDPSQPQQLPKEYQNYTLQGSQEPLEPEPEYLRNKTKTELHSRIKELGKDKVLLKSKVRSLEKENEKLRQEVDRLKATYEPEGIISLVQLASRNCGRK